MQQKKKILFVITKPNWGGAQRYVFDMATNLPRERFDVTVAHGGKGLLAEKLQEVGIRTIPIPHLERDISFFKESRAFLALLSMLRYEHPNVVHINSSKAVGLGALLEDRSVVAKTLIWIASWLTVLLCHKIICISEYDLRIAKRMPFIGKKAVRIYNGIVPMSFGRGEKIRNAFPPGVKITGTVGELTHNKNQTALVEEARSKSDMYVAIVGFGEDYTILDYKIKKYGLQNQVKLFGFIPVKEVLKGFDIFALPSLKEGLPYVLLEARAAGLPIIANRVGGVPEILDAKDLSDFSLQTMLEKTTALYEVE